MVKENQYINIKEVLSRVLRHPLLQDVDLEQAIQYTIDFIGIFGMPKLYQDREDKVEIHNYRGKLPCDIIAINQVKDCNSGICLRSMTDNFIENESSEMTFKTQGRTIFTSFKEGEILVSYKTIPLDKDGLPLLIDNPIYLRTLEAYIKKEVFTILFDMAKITQQSLQNTQQEYAFKAAQLQGEFNIPSVSEMESISRMWNTLIPRITEFNNGFKELGSREYIKNH